jgi:tight adherence protein C
VDIVALLGQREFLISVLAAISAAAVVFTFGSSFLVKSEMRDRIKRVALEREKMRAEEMARLRGAIATDTRGIRRTGETKTYMKNVVERFDLKKAFQDDATVDKLAMAGYRGQGHLTTFLFTRLAAPIVIFLIAVL